MGFFLETHYGECGFGGYFYVSGKENMVQVSIQTSHQLVSSRICFDTGRTRSQKSGGNKKESTLCNIKIDKEHLLQYPIFKYIYISLTSKGHKTVVFNVLDGNICEIRIIVLTSSR